MTNNGHVLRTYICKEDSTRLKDYAQKNGGSLFMGLVASLNVMFHKYTSQEEFIIGTPVAGRNHVDLEDQIGFYVNTLALRNQVNGSESFDTLFSRVKQNTLDAYEHQVYPFDRLVEDLDLKRDTSRGAIFDVMLTLQNVGEKLEGVEIGDTDVEMIIDCGEGVSKFDLDFTFQEIGDYIIFSVDYNTDIYEKEVIERFIGHYKNILQAITESPEELIKEIDYLTKEEKYKLLYTFNDTEIDYQRDKTIVDLFEEHAANTPDNVAVVFEDRELTYRELNERSNQLADYLRSNYGIQPDDLIGINLERSEEIIIAILGVLKSGGAYVPIDPNYPQQRVDYMIEDSQCRVLVDKNEWSNFINNISKYSNNNLSRNITPDNLVYVIYTSGSTGNPKGVMVTHKNTISITESWKSIYNLEDIQVNLLQMASMSFDVFFGDICRSLLTGGKMIICSQQVQFEFENLYKLMVNQKVSILESTPGFLLPFIDYLSENNRTLDSLSLLIFGSDSFKFSYNEKIKKIFKNNIRIINSYGVTEATIDSSYFEFIDNYENSIRNTPIGRPINNQSIYILDKDLMLRPIGVIGEICISGEGLARGYLNRPELTADKFVANPFAEGKRMYKTGDLGRWLTDGNIEFIGRKDDQVKIRGYRIELGEIENSLQKNGLIDDAVVLAKEDVNGDKNIIAYLMSKEELNSSDLRIGLSKQLPDYMIPSYFIQVEEFPLTPNGKVDKKSLPSPEGVVMRTGVEYVASRNEMEEKLVEIWEQVLTKERIGVQDNFFALGGHSLKAIRLISLVSRELEVRLTLNEVFTQVTIEEQAELLNKSIKTDYINIGSVPESESYAISDAQRRLWVLSQFEGGSVAYNMPSQIELDGDYDIESFKLAIEATIERHEILRTVFKEDDKGEVRQWILSKEDLGFEIVYKDYRGEENKDEKLKEYMSKDSNSAFDLEQGPLLRASLLQIEEDQYVFYYNMHHIISDGWSMEVLAKDVLTYYEGYEENKIPELAPLRIQYKDYSAWQLSQLEEESYQINKTYWLDQLSGELPLLELPMTKHRPLLKTNRGHSLGTYLGKEETSKLKEYVQERGGTLFMGLLASLNTMFYRYSNQEDIIIGSPIAGREHADLENQIGFYINTLTLRNQVNGSDSFDVLFEKVKENTLNAYTHQMYPFDRLVEDLDLKRDTSRSALFDVMVTLQNNGEKVEGIEIKQEEINIINDYGEGVSKFDLNFTFEAIGDYISFNINYNTDIYEKEIVERFIVHYKGILQAIVESPEESIQSLEYLSSEEEYQLLQTFNDTKVDYPKDKTLVDLFEDQVASTPDNVAVVFEEVELTYNELNERSNQLADYLRSTYKIQPDDLVGIKLERSEHMIVSIIGILKAGGAYFSVDSNFPEERINYMIKDSQCKVLINHEELIKFNERQDKYSKENLTVITSSNNLVYITYTSGSTGRPKGVMIEHSALLDYTFGIISNIEIKECKSFGLVSTIAADLGNTIIFPCLLTGGELHVFTDDEIRSSLLASSKSVDCLKITPSHWKSLQDKSITFMPNKCLIFGGEQLPVDIVQNINLFGYTGSVYNHYGPTETTVGKLLRKIDHQDDVVEITLGKPFGNSQVYILDNNEQLQPIGVIGEICIGGDGLARGYLNKQYLTAEKFVLNPFVEGERMYKTGDLGKWLPDGNIEFIGRLDDQVKVRGYRIELGEIESMLQQNALIDEAIVLVKEDVSGDKSIVAYVVSKEELNSTELRKGLSKQLPDYMLPSYFVQLEELPLTTNGKVDKKALPSPEGLGMSTGVEYVAPRNEMEEKLVAIWEEVLGREKIGIQDNFFELGGHSLHAMRLNSLLYKNFEIKLKLNEIFTRVTIEEQVELLSKSIKTDYTQIPEATESKSYELSSAQRRLWVLSQFEGGSITYNMPFQMELDGDYDIES
jgi:amino acid adenylation domain-containing protein